MANPTVFGLQPGVKWVTPEIYDWNITFERQLRSDTVLHAFLCGNARDPSAAGCESEPRLCTRQAALRRLQRGGPTSRLAVIYQNRNTGANAYNGLQVDLEKRPARAATGILEPDHAAGQLHLFPCQRLRLVRKWRHHRYRIKHRLGHVLLRSAAACFRDRTSYLSTTGTTFVASYVWTLPRLSGSNGLLRNVVGGWQWTGIYSFTSGDPLTILAGTDRSQTGNNLDRADYIGPANQFGKSPSSQPGGCTGVKHCFAWLNPALFAKPTAGNYGNAGKGSWRGPNLWDVDTGLIKNFYPIRRAKTSTSSSGASSSTCSTTRSGPIRM